VKKIFLLLLALVLTLALLPASAEEDEEVYLFGKDSAFAKTQPTITVVVSDVEPVELELKPEFYQTEALNLLPGNYVALTFDDGYSRIKMILDALRKEGIKCTFFVIGSRLGPARDLWRQAVADGHEICYHSMYHDSFSGKTEEWIRNDITEWEATAKDVLGENYVIPKIARLPGGTGHKSERILKIFNDLDYVVVGWTADSGVVKEKKPHYIANYVLRHMAEAGCIMLQHFNSYDGPSVREYAEKLKDRSEKKGLILTKISDALLEAGYWKER
jgi:peptidoglycan/xylan/chitin deacetylase (PgdA/CDA1 family)